jgi:hypothetical protein
MTCNPNTKERRPEMNKGLVCGFVLVASLAWGQEPTSTASMQVNKGSVEQNQNLGFTVKVQPTPTTRSTVEVTALPVAGGNGYKSICTLHPNEDTCDVVLHIPADAATGTYKIAAVKVAPMSGTYKDLKLTDNPPTFDVMKGSAVLPDSADVAIKQH